MTRAATRRKSSAFDGPTLFGPPDQGSLFGDEPDKPKAYVAEQRHVRNRLRAILDKMEGADRWPWEPVMVRLHRERTFEYLYGLLTDKDEAAEWRERIDAEIARLDEAEA